ncbi:MAG: threonylcarbamoyl-AMP synthase [bacterium]|nr:threonylcarbamoyl-AMP synthase [bacterium]
MEATNRVAPTAKTPALILESDEDSMAKVVLSLHQGLLVAFPTETVYGLGADAGNEEAVASIFAAKGRPSYNPLIIHVKDLATAQLYGHFDHHALKLAAHFWPGPLTLVVPRLDNIPLSPLVSAGLSTIALRVPANKIAGALLEAFDGPVAAPSANRSGLLSPTEAEHVEEMLGDQVSLILDGGPCEGGIESTIIGFEGNIPVLLRPGILPVEQVEAIIGIRLQMPLKDAEPSAIPFVVTAPGQLTSHYAPRAHLRLNAVSAFEGELMLAFGPDAPKGQPGVNLSPVGDLAEAAANLYAYLHLLDDTGVETIAVMPIPQEGVGVAINDRLNRAAAPRPVGSNGNEQS